MWWDEISDVNAPSSRKQTGADKINTKLLSSDRPQRTYVIEHFLERGGDDVADTDTDWTQRVPRHPVLDVVVNRLQKHLTACASSSLNFTKQFSS